MSASEQLTLSLPFVRGSQTSMDAAEQAKPNAASQRARVLKLITESCWRTDDSGLTDQQIQDRLKMDGNTERPRRNELVERGLIKDSGRRRKTTKGCLAIVWVLV